MLWLKTFKNGDSQIAFVYVGYSQQYLPCCKLGQKFKHSKPQKYYTSYQRANIVCAHQALSALHTPFIALSVSGTATYISFATVKMQRQALSGKGVDTSCPGSSVTPFVFFFPLPGCPWREVNIQRHSSEFQQHPQQILMSLLTPL